MECPECGLNDVATDDDGIKPHPRPDTLQLCTGPVQPPPEPAHQPPPEPAQSAHKPAPKKAAAKVPKPHTKR